jgi:hypothetical protein
MKQAAMVRMGTRGRKTEFWWETHSKTSTWKAEMEDNITIQLREMDSEDWRWVELAQDRVHWRALVLPPQCLLLYI